MKFKKLIFLCLAALFSQALFSQEYHPTPENVKAREALVNERFGIFIHWGIYSTFAQGEWYLQTGSLNKDEYAKVASAFYPIEFDANEWVKAFKESGAEYVTFTTRHHDGFSMYDSKVSDYNIVNSTPFKRDIVRELADACHEQGLAMQFYYSLLDWIREDFPLGESGHETGRVGDQQDYAHYFDFMKSQVKELIENYAPVRALWFDGWWDHKRDTIPFDWRMPEFYEYIHSIKPDCLIGNNHHVQTFPGEDFQMFERDFPGQNTEGYSEGQTVSESLPLEMCQTMNHSWGYKVSDPDYKSLDSLVHTLARAVSMNSNLLLNVGPQPNGRIPDAALVRLKGIGEWLSLNQESIKGCGPGPLKEQSWGVTTAPNTGGKTFYAHVFKPETTEIDIPIAAKTKVKSVSVLSNGKELAFRKVEDRIVISLPSNVTLSDSVIKITLR